MNFYTIGVYGLTQEEYFNKLVNANIDLFCDIRQRRGVRGKKYSFVNSTRLQEKLHDLNINYLHIKDLAPTKEMRNKQKEDDIKNNILKRDRNILGNKFISSYTEEILNNYNLNDTIQYFKENKFKNIVFFCVEEHFQSCHRSLVAQEIYAICKTEIKDL
jgi:uncharacterized protein (DUF488 family)